jgi:hypothetical protein
MPHNNLQDDNATPKLGLKRLARFKELKALHYAESWHQLDTLIRKHGFPPGKYLSDRVRVWDIDAVAAWYEARPLAKSALPPGEGA